MMQNLFYALFPDAATLVRIDDTGTALKSLHVLDGRRISRALLHLTLHFIGRFAKSAPQVERHALAVGDRIACAPFDVVLDRVLTFPRARGSAPCVFECSAPAAPLLSIERELRVGMAELPDMSNEPFPFRPHLTWLHTPNRIAEPRQIDSIIWRADEFVLAKSVQGKSHYRILRRWPFSRS